MKDEAQIKVMSEAQLFLDETVEEVVGFIDGYPDKKAPPEVLTNTNIIAQKELQSIRAIRERNRQHSIDQPKCRMFDNLRDEVMAGIEELRSNKDTDRDETERDYQ